MHVYICIYIHIYNIYYAYIYLFIYILCLHVFLFKNVTIYEVNDETFKVLLYFEKNRNIPRF